MEINDNINNIVDELMQDILENIISNFDTNTHTSNTYTLTEAQRDQLIRCKYKDIHSDISSDRTINDFCPFYQIKFSDEDNIIILPCNHCFSTEPLLQWLTTKKAECPLCKYNFPIDNTVSRIREIIDEENDLLEAISRL